MNSLKRKLLESKTSEIQKKVVDYLDPENLLDLERSLVQALRTESILVKLARELNIDPARVERVIEEFLELIDLMQL